MTWIAGSLLLLGAALVAGFAWYERSHPTARVLALVAALAALAVIGRIAFAPIPNVKPTTDIVLLTGYVLGGAPGFAVGAVAAVASNLFFGQGPWTPWQMFAWGLVGVGGAGLARLFGRELGRGSLAAACAVAGLVYGGIMNVSLWVLYSGDHTLAKLGAYFATSFPFDLAHVVGNVLFCLALGPVLVRALRRYRSRFSVEWLPAAPAAAALAALLVLAAPAGQDARAAVPKAPVRYLLDSQNSDGGFPPSPRAGSTQLHTGWAALGLAAVGRHPGEVGALRYMRQNAADLRGDVGELTRTMLVLGAAGESARDFAGRDLLAELLARRREDSSWSGRVNTTAFAVLALRAAGRGRRDPVVRNAANWIARRANPDGGFAFSGRGASGIDETGAVLQALVAAGRKRSKVVRRAARFLVRRQNPDGGFPLAPGGPSNAQSTAWVVQGLVAAGRDPDRVRRDGARSPLAYLRRLIGSDGAIRYSRTSTQTPVWVTSQALLALARRPFPLRPVARRADAARTTGAERPSAPPIASTEGRSAPAPEPEETPAPAPARVAETVGTVPDLGATARAAGYVAGLAFAPLV